MKKWLNNSLNAYNVLEIDLEKTKLDEVGKYFLKEIRPNLENKKTTINWSGAPYCEVGDPHGEDYWFILDTPWNSDLRWVSVNNIKTYKKWVNLFYYFNFDKIFSEKIDYDKEINIYSIFFVVRSLSTAYNFHYDWLGDANANAFTSMAPIQECRDDTINLAYKDTNDNQHEYKYQKGKAIAFSEDFIHSTEVGKSKTSDAFLCFSFGSDKEKYQSINQKTGAYQSKHYMDPQKGWSLTNMNKKLFGSILDEWDAHHE